jgi:hypothetical protein
LPDGSIDAPGLVDRDRDRLLEARGATDAVGISFLAVSSQRPDIAVRCHDPDGMVAAIAYIDIAFPIDREAVRPVELSDLAIAVSQTGLTTTCEGCNPHLRLSACKTRSAQRNRQQH